MMAEYIERKKAIFPLYRWRNIIRNTYGENDEYVKCLNEAIEKIENVAAADVEPVVHGKFTRHVLKNANVPWGVDCSACGAWFVISEDTAEKYNYCPNCGARMDGGKNV